MCRYQSVYIYACRRTYALLCMNLHLRIRVLSQVYYQCCPPNRSGEFDLSAYRSIYICICAYSFSFQYIIVHGQCFVLHMCIPNVTLLRDKSRVDTFSKRYSKREYTCILKSMYVLNHICV